MIREASSTVSVMAALLTSKPVGILGCENRDNSTEGPAVLVACDDSRYEDFKVYDNVMNLEIMLYIAKTY